MQMPRREFTQYKAGLVTATRRVLAQGTSDVLSEAAFPAYANPNPLISHLFWSRIRTVEGMLQGRHVDCALDFGCGGGVFLPLLARHAARVTGLDLDIAPHRALRQFYEFPSNVAVTDDASTLAPRSHGVVIALDVLEHVDDLDASIRQLVEWTVPGGMLIVSGPTENILYKAGRLIAGPTYSGEYHVRGVAAIEAELRRQTAVERRVTLYPGCPFFRLYACRVA